MAPDDPSPPSEPDTLWRRLRRKRANDVIAAQVENSEHVAVGKNIIQIGSLQIPRWVAAVVVVGTILVAAFAGITAYFSRQTGANTEQVIAILAATATPTPSPTPIPTPTATPLPFAPARTGETLILVVPFHGQAAAASEPHQRIWRKIHEELAKIPGEQTRVEIDPNVVLGYDQRNEAEALGKQYNASMVIWGEATDIAVTVSFLNLRQPDFAAADVSIDETARSRLVNPSAYAQFIVKDLPATLAFLALYAVGQSYYVNSNWDAAERVLAQAIATTIGATDVPTGLADAYWRLGWIHQRTKAGLESAIAEYGEALKLDPQLTRAYMNRGVAYLHKGEPNQAIDDFSQAIQLEPNNPLGYTNRGLAYVSTGDFERANIDYDRATSLNPQDAIAYYNKGFSDLDKGDSDAAIADFSQVIALVPQLASAYYNRGVAYDNKGDLEHAAADYSQAIALDPKFALAFDNRGIIHDTRGEYDLAIADYERAITLDPKFAKAYNNRALAYVHKGEFERALKDYDQAITLNPDFSTAYANRGIAHARLGDLEAAIADYDRAIALEPQHADAYVNRGDARAAQGDIDAAIADYQQALQLNPQDADTYNNICWSMAIYGKPQEALPNCEKAVELNPDPAIMDTRGMTYALLGDYPAAIADFQAFVDWTQTQTDPQMREFGVQRMGWIETLKQGNNPLTPAVVEQLRRE